EEQFIKMSQERGTIVFDARSDDKYRLLHIKGATHLSLPDMTAAELAKVIPEKTARILIYCNNNFDNEPAAFPAKAMDASLNIFTFNTLYSYGYKNIYELGPVIDANHTKLQFEGTRASTPRRRASPNPTAPLSIALPNQTLLRRAGFGVGPYFVAL